MFDKHQISHKARKCVYSFKKTRLRYKDENKT